MEVVYQPEAPKPYSKPTITVNINLSWKPTLQRAVHTGDEITASTATNQCDIWQTSWTCPGAEWDTKLSLQGFWTACACDTLTVYQGHDIGLNHFHFSCLRKLLEIR